MGANLYGLPSLKIGYIIFIGIDGIIQGAGYGTQSRLVKDVILVFEDSVSGFQIPNIPCHKWVLGFRVS